MCITLHVTWKWNPIIVFHFFLSTVITWLTVCFLNSYRWHMGERYLMELNLTTDWMVSWWIFVIRIHMYFRNNWLAFLSFFLTFRISCFNAKCDWICCLCLLQSLCCFGVWHISWNHNSNPHMVCSGFCHCLCHGPHAEEGTLSRRKHRFLNMKHFL